MATKKELDRAYMGMAIAMSKLSKGVRAKVGGREDSIFYDFYHISAIAKLNIAFITAQTISRFLIALVGFTDRVMTSQTIKECR